MEVSKRPKTKRQRRISQNVVLTLCVYLFFVKICHTSLQMQSYSFFLKKRENKLFFCFLSLKICRQQSLLENTSLNHILSLLFFRSRVVAAPIQVQFSSNSSPIQVQFSSNPSPIGNWKYIVFALSLHSRIRAIQISEE